MKSDMKSKMTDSALFENIKTIYRQISHAAMGAGREPGDVKLIAITKTVDARRIKEAIDWGLRIFGESRVQEAKVKIEEFSRLSTIDYRLPTISWHLVGHLQKNKAKTAVQLFDLIHSLDSIELAEELDKHAERAGKFQRVLIQVKLSEEETKHGVPKEGLADLIEVVAEMKNLKIEGLMTIPPFFDDPEMAKPYFRELRELRDNAVKSGYELPELSMGMTHDFEIAIEEGATMVRIGTAIFGERK
ncbi:MAG: YggS family pyridoxal phosphate-dependent enzyme [Thermodesulfovibrionales bacterium]|nr:YggS family pyridoxal phosphate-dependent enzyme [Thermodesulfovibrionales bacterium]